MANYHTLTPQEMLDKIKGVDPAAQVRMRKFGDFYIGGSLINEKQGSLLRSLYGNGETPELAVKDHFIQLVNSYNLIYDEPNCSGPYCFTGYSIYWNDTLRIFSKKKLGDI